MLQAWKHLQLNASGKSPGDRPLGFCKTLGLKKQRRDTFDLGGNIAGALIIRIGFWGILGGYLGIWGA